MVAYGDDDYTRRHREIASATLRRRGAAPFLVFNGTGANVTAVDALTEPTRR